MVGRSVCAAALLASGASAAQMQHTANPVRRVVKMLQMMQKKVEAEGKRDQELYDKYMCYCKTGDKDLTASIKAAEEKIPKVTSGLTAAKAKKDQLVGDLKTHKADLAEANDALEKATALRKKDAATFAKADAEATADIKAMTKADMALVKGLGGAFLQTEAATVVRRLANEVDMDSTERDNLNNYFTSNGEDVGTEEILGIIRQMKDTMTKDQIELRANEESAIKSYAELKGAKEKEISATTKIIEDKTARVGKTGVLIENLREDLEDTTNQYEDDKSFLVNLDKNCALRKKEYDVVEKLRAEEMVALADTVKILNDDDSLDLFKKTLPNPSAASFLQVDVTDKEVRQEAVEVLGKARTSRKVVDPRLDFILLAVRGKKFSFDKVLGMIDGMVKVLKTEQGADDQKKAYCEDKIDKAEDEGKQMRLEISDLGKSMEDTTSAIETFTTEIAGLTAGIKALDKSVADATANRKAENAEYEKTRAADSAAKELLKLARNRMNKFYAPGNYKAAPKQELGAQQRIAVNMGSEAAPTVKPSGIAGTGITAFVQTGSESDAEAVLDESVGAAPPPPPEAVAAFKKKGSESAGVIQMLDLLINDMEKELAEIETEEKDSQKDYEKFIADSAVKRSTDAKALSEKEGMKVESQVFLEKTKMSKKAKEKEEYANAVLQRDLHQECDWLLANYGTRKKARAGEIDSLSKAKAILSGSSDSFLQVGSTHRLLRGGQ